MISKIYKLILVSSMLMVSFFPTASSYAVQSSIPTCNLENISGLNITNKPLVLSAKNSEKSVFRGWVAQTSSKMPNPTSVAIDFFSTSKKKVIIEFKSSKVVPRKDVQKYFKNSAIQNVGFIVSADSSIPSGDYKIFVKSTYRNQTSTFSCGGWPIQVQ